MSTLSSCEDLLHFAFPSFGGERFLVTANADGSIPLNAKEGPSITNSCVQQANLACELLEACAQAEHWLSQPDRSIEPVAMLDVLRKVIAKAQELHREF